MHSSGIAKVLVLIGVIPLCSLAAATLSAELSAFRNPCIAWNTRSVRLSPKPGPPCLGTRQARSATKTEAALRLVILDGIILLASALALVGVFRSRPVLGYSAFLILIIISFPLFASAVGFLTLFSALAIAAATVFPPETSGSE